MASKKKSGYFYKKIETYPGSKFGKLTAIEVGAPYMSPSSGKLEERWVYECECGNRVNWKPATVRYNTKRGMSSCAECYKKAIAEGTWPPK